MNHRFIRHRTNLKMVYNFRNALRNDVEIHSNFDGYDDFNQQVDDTTPSLARTFSYDENLAAKYEEPVERASKKLLKLSLTHGMPIACYDKMIKVVNEYIDGTSEPLHSHYRSKKLLENEYPVIPIKYDICSKGCMMYQKDDGLTRCTYCNRPRFSSKHDTDGNKKPERTMIQLPLMDQLAALIKNEKTRGDLMYRAELPPQTAGVYKDVFDGNAYNELRDHGCFEGKLDIAIALYTDGFIVKEQPLTIIHVIILNLPPSIRYEKENMIQIGIIYGEEAPKDLYSFLQPLMNDLEALETTGMNIVADDGETYIVRVHCMLATGDGPAASKMMHHKGHQCAFGCRFCVIQGAGVAKNPGERKTGMYFESKKNAPATPRTVDSFETGDWDRGIKKPVPFAKLKSFKGASFFGLDIMHLLGPCVGRQFWELLCGEHGKENNPLYLMPAIRRKIGLAIVNSTPLLPSSFTSCTKDISQNTRLKSIDWIDFMRYMVPTIVLEHYKDAATRKAIFALTQVYRIAFQKEITDKEIDYLSTNVWRWLLFLQKKVSEGKILATVNKISQHHLVHLAEMIRAMGPPRYYAAFAMERAIGEISHAVNSCTDAGVNAGNIMVDLAAQRYLEKTTLSLKFESKEKNILAVSKEPNAIEIWSPLWPGNVAEYEEAYNLEKLLLAFWKIYLTDVTEVNPKFKAGSRLWLSELETAGSAYRPRNKSRRDDFHVIMHIEVYNRSNAIRTRRTKVYFGKVIFYFLHTQQSKSMLLALIEAFDVSLDPHGQPYLQQNCNTQYCVISASDIQSTVGMLKSSNNRRYLVWPQMRTLKGAECGKITWLDY